MGKSSMVEVRWPSSPANTMSEGPASLKTLSCHLGGANIDGIMRLNGLHRNPPLEVYKPSTCNLARRNWVETRIHCSLHALAGVVPVS